ncbi:MAG: hypothetical protein JWR38_3713 [Mucilaginibacter sp.]|nr:hypothetical protein [Mucilaginibacter sp.]
MLLKILTFIPYLPPLYLLNVNAQNNLQVNIPFFAKK